MADKAKQRMVASIKFVHTLAAQAGVSPEEIRDIISLVGFDREAIFRKARDRRTESKEQSSALKTKSSTR